MSDGSPVPPPAPARTRHTILQLLMLAAFIGAAGVSAGLCRYGLRDQADTAFLLAGLIGVVMVLASVPLLVLAWMRLARPARSPIEDDVAALAQAMDRFSQHSALSDDARRVLNRKRERELLRRAIEEDMSAGEWDAAMVLVRELAERFGYRADAEEFRRRIETSRAETLERNVSDAISLLDGLIIQRRWDLAYSEAGRVTRLFPDSPRVEGLRARVDQARLSYRSDLERRFLLAAQASRAEEALELLRELDGYLTAAEAAPYQELARGVIGKARDNLGAQFKLAVQDRHWRHAADLGEQIIQHFPNSRMAEEIRGMIDGIRSRASRFHSGSDPLPLRERA
jgi:hypothetical protein